MKKIILAVITLILIGFTGCKEPITEVTVTFVLNGGNIDGKTENIVVKGFPGDSLKAPAAPKMDDYEFERWSPIVPDTFPSTDMIYVAQWEGLFTATFHLNGGNIDGKTDDVVIRATEGSALTPPVNPQREGFEFIGWEKTVPATYTEENIVFWAKWDELISVTFILNGGHINGKTENIVVKGTPGEPLKAPADPHREGYEFIGWDKTLPVTFPEENIVILAQWQGLISVTLVLNGGNIDGKTENVVAKGFPGDPLKAPDAPQREGCVFKGWDRTIPATFPKHNVNFEAQWIFSFYFTSTGQQSLSIKDSDMTIPESLQYSVDEGKTWSQPSLNTPISFGNETILYLRGKSESGMALSRDSYLYFSFATNAPVECHGDIRNLVDWEDIANVDTSKVRFCNLFQDCKQLTKAPDLLATTLTEICYWSMFSGCTNLTQAPELPRHRTSERLLSLYV